jgi:ProP effector
MSNLSLKDQLKALSMGLSTSTDEEPTKKLDQKNPARSTTSSRPPRSSQPAPSPKSKQKPTWLEQAQYGVELLKAHFPNCFKELKETRPLKVGIKQDLVKNLSAREDIVLGDKACMVNSLAYYVNSVAYHKSMTEGMVRIDLDGNDASVVSAEEAQYSSDCRKAKQNKKEGMKSPASQNVTE